MSWFNLYGLVIMIIIMIPNIVYALLNKDETAPYRNKFLGILEQIGRYGCLIFMIFNIPYTYFNYWFENALIVYLSVNGGLCILYLLSWIFFRHKRNVVKALSLSVIPTVIFLFSGIVVASIPLLVLSVLFGFSHIYISYKNKQ